MKVNCFVKKEALKQVMNTLLLGKYSFITFSRQATLQLAIDRRYGDQSNQMSNEIERRIEMETASI